MRGDNLREWILMVTDEEKEALTRLLNEMRELASTSTAADASVFKHFLPKETQRVTYRRYAHTYYSNHISGRNLSHKQLMVHWAAIYDVIAERTGIKYDLRTNTLMFYGPEYDHFLIDFCGIRYNESDDRKGRYRQVGTVFRRFATLDSDFNLSENDAKMYKLYCECKKAFRKTNDDPNSRNFRGSYVPCKL